MIVIYIIILAHKTDIAIQHEVFICFKWLLIYIFVTGIIRDYNGYIVYTLN